MKTLTVALGAFLLGTSGLAPLAAQTPKSAPVPLAPASAEPERIILNLTADTAHEMAVTWRSAPGLPGRVEYAVATPGPDFVKAPMRQDALTENGPAGVPEAFETHWYTDYQGLRLISIDSPQFDRNEVARAQTIAWLDALLAHNPNRWTVLFLHFPLFSSDPARDNPKVRSARKPLIDKHKVDLVLQGHDHGYARGAIGPQGPAADDAGTTYVVSVAGPKMYDVAELAWAGKSAARTQAFQVIDVAPHQLSYKAYTANGEPLDAAVLHKP
ncbi:metallophosphoesterase family protein [Novosphingobium sp. 1949]|uniref:Metallophosphoesterase family protein n=1 Tax=Novosphingobium organovorum TaxID=2930092 RepID=A0ABT0BHB0_9SPHN|nr:metallophosphoesterase [Novosphingobium organovorum]MCJ2184462.1 metallophosphoesterase family protein [Novosphingobium organovorum]